MLNDLPVGPLSEVHCVSGNSNLAFCSLVGESFNIFSTSRNNKLRAIRVYDNYLITLPLSRSHREEMPAASPSRRDKKCPQSRTYYLPFAMHQLR